MKNRWKASVKTEEQAGTENSTAQPKNNSKKIGIAMGIVGALLVTAGVAPMVFNGDNLTGDITQTEEIDPLVALLSSTPSTTTAPGTSSTPLATPTQALASVPPVSPSSSTAKPVPSPKSTAQPKASSTANTTEVDKILSEEGEPVMENKNIGKKDETGSLFDTSDNLHSAAALSNTSSPKSSADAKPKTMVQTGVNTSLVIGFLFLLLGAALSFSGMIRRKK